MGMNAAEKKNDYGRLRMATHYPEATNGEFSNPYFTLLIFGRNAICLPLTLLIVLPEKRFGVDEN